MSDQELPDGPDREESSHREPPHPEEVLEEPGVGALILSLADRPHTWIHRRVESVGFCDDKTVRRSVSVDFSIPEPAPSVASSKGRVTLIPLAHLQKRPLVGFDLFDETGQTIPLLTVTETGVLVADGLIHLARQIIHGNHTTELDRSLESDIQAITSSDYTQAKAAEHAILHMRSDRVRGALADHRVFRMLVRRYTRLFLMLIPLEDDQRTRRVIKFQYNETLRRSGGPWRLLIGDPSIAGFYTPGLQEAAGYHLEVDMPDGVGATSVSLEPDAARTRRETQEDNESSAADTDSQVVGSKVHLCVKYFPPEAEAKAIAALRPTRTGWLASACMSIWLIALILVMGTVWIKSRPRIADPSTAHAAVTLLLVIPGIFATLLVRQAEHPMTTYVLRAVRSLLVIAGLTTYVAAATLIMAESRSQIRLYWTIYAILTSLIAVMVTLALLTPPMKHRIARLIMAASCLLLWVGLALFLALSAISITQRMVLVFIVVVAVVAFNVGFLIELRSRLEARRNA